MTFGQLVQQFFADGKVEALAVLIVVDLLVGIAAAFKLGNFRLSYVADFLRNDVAFKVVPYFVLHAAAIVAGQRDILIDGLDWGVIAGGAYGVLVVALAASILKSVGDLGLRPGPTPEGTQTVETALFGAENAAPPKD